MTLSFYLTLENPEALRAELVEQKLSMLYLKSQVNPHFLYNTLDTIRIQAHLNGDKTVASLLMRLVDFSSGSASRWTDPWSRWTTRWSCWKPMWS